MRSLLRLSNLLLLGLSLALALPVSARAVPEWTQVREEDPACSIADIDTALDATTYVLFNCNTRMEVWKRSPGATTMTVETFGTKPLSDAYGYQASIEAIDELRATVITAHTVNYGSGFRHVAYRRALGGWDTGTVFRTGSSGISTLLAEGDDEGNVTYAYTHNSSDLGGATLTSYGTVPATGPIPASTDVPEEMSIDLAVAPNGRAVLALADAPLGATTRTITRASRSGGWAQQLAPDADYIDRVAINDAGATTVVTQPSAGSTFLRVSSAGADGSEDFIDVAAPGASITDERIWGLAVDPDGTTVLAHLASDDPGGTASIDVHERAHGATTFTQTDSEVIPVAGRADVDTSASAVAVAADGTIAASLVASAPSATPYRLDEVALLMLRPTGAGDWRVQETRRVDAANVADLQGTQMSLSQVGGNHAVARGFAVGGGTAMEVHVRDGVPVPFVDPVTYLTDDRTPTLVFGAFDPADVTVTFECRVDANPTWTPCAPPSFTAPSDLPDGEHTIDVRSVRDGLHSAAVRRTWRIDTTAPVLGISESPAATSTSTTQTITLLALDASAVTYECRLSPAATFTPCSAIPTYSGLTPGAYTFAARATDALGHVSSVVTTSFTIITPPPTQTPPTNDGTGGGGGGTQPPKSTTPERETVGCSSAAARNAMVVGVAGVLARDAKSCLIRGANGSYSGSGSFWVNGIAFTGKVGLDPVRLTGRFDGTYTLGGLPFYKMSGVKELAGASRRFTVAIPPGAKVKGYAIEGSAELELTPDNGGQSKTTVDIALPNWITVKRLGPGEQSSEGTGTGIGVTVTASNTAATTISGKLVLTSAYLKGRFRVNDLTLAFDGETGAISGSAELILPTPNTTEQSPDFLKRAVALQIQINGERYYAVSILAQRLNMPLGYGMMLQNIGGEFNTVAAAPYASVQAAISGGPTIAIGDWWNGYILLLQGSGKVLGEADGLAMELEGTGQLLNSEFSKAKVRWQSWDGSLTATGDAYMGALGYGLRYSVRDAQLNPIGGNVLAIEGSGVLTLPGLGTQQASVLFGLGGVAACTGPRNARAGSAFLFSSRTWMHSGACDLGRFRQDIAIPIGAPKQAKRADRAPRTGATATAASVGATVRTGQSVVRFAVHGAESAPRIALVAPGGARTEMPVGGAGVQSAKVSLVQDDTARTTFVTIWSPAAGRWTFEPLAGSAAITAVDQADALPPVQVSAKVTGKGAKRTAAWKARPLEGQDITLVERGKFGTRVIGKLRGASGAKRFAPASGTGGRRQLVAVVTQYGNLRAQVVLATYQVAHPPQPTKPAKVSAVRAGSTGAKAKQVVVTLRAQPGATRYHAQLVLADGTRILRSSRSPKFVFTGVTVGVSGKVAVWSTDATRTSRAVTVPVKAAPVRSKPKR